MPMALTYTNYLKLDMILNAQEPKSDPEEHDETLFIIIHQVYELWFKLLLHELDKVKGDLSANRLYEAMSTIKRVRMVLKTLVGQLDILETMTPMEFNSFRDRLESASGLQSYQFRELEFLLGMKRPDIIKRHDDHPAGKAALEKRLNEPSIMHCFYDFLEHNGVEIPEELRSKPIDESNIANEHIQDSLVEIYKTKPDISILLESLTDIDEGLMEWRYRHVKMVERTIGNKMGTGGMGVEYLKASLFKPFFPDLWAIRGKL